MSGTKQTMLYANAAFNAQLQLVYANITPADAAKYMEHYDYLRGTFGTFKFSNKWAEQVWGGWNKKGVDEKQLAIKGQWRYAAPPRISQPKYDVVTVEIALKQVPGTRGVTDGKDFATSPIPSTTSAITPRNGGGSEGCPPPPPPLYPPAVPGGEPEDPGTPPGIRDPFEPSEPGDDGPIPNPPPGPGDPSNPDPGDPETCGPCEILINGQCVPDPACEFPDKDEDEIWWRGFIADKKRRLIIPYYRCVTARDVPEGNYGCELDGDRRGSQSLWMTSTKFGKSEGPPWTFEQESAWNGAPAVLREPRGCFSNLTGMTSQNTTDTWRGNSYNASSNPDGYKSGQWELKSKSGSIVGVINGSSAQTFVSYDNTLAPGGCIDTEQKLEYTEPAYELIALQAGSPNFTEIYYEWSTENVDWDGPSPQTLTDSALQNTETISAEPEPRATSNDNSRFPTHNPSTRRIKYGDWNVKKAKPGLSSQNTTLKLPRTAVKQDVSIELTYANREDAVARDLMNHYFASTGEWNDFKIPPDSLTEGVMAGWRGSKNYFTNGHWSYARPPEVASVHPGTSTTKVTLLFVGPEIGNGEGPGKIPKLPNCPPPPIEFKSTVRIQIIIDDSGSMSNVENVLVLMKDTVLKTCLLPFYKNDEDLYNNGVRVLYMSTIGVERTYKAAYWDTTADNDPGDPTTNIINLIFQDEARPAYTSSSWTINSTPSSAFVEDMSNLNTRFSNYSQPGLETHQKQKYNPGYMRTNIFQVTNTSNDGRNFKSLMKAVENGDGSYTGNLSTKKWNEIVGYTYDIPYVNDPFFYVNLIIDAINKLGYNAPSCKR